MYMWLFNHWVRVSLRGDKLCFYERDLRWSIALSLPNVSQIFYSRFFLPPPSPAQTGFYLLERLKLYFFFQSQDSKASQSHFLIFPNSLMWLYLFSCRGAFSHHVHSILASTTVVTLEHLIVVLVYFPKSLPTLLEAKIPRPKFDSLIFVHAGMYPLIQSLIYSQTFLARSFSIASTIAWVTRTMDGVLLSTG